MTFPPVLCFPILPVLPAANRQSRAPVELEFEGCLPVAQGAARLRLPVQSECIGCIHSSASCGGAPLGPHVFHRLGEAWPLVSMSEQHAPSCAGRYAVGSAVAVAAAYSTAAGCFKPPPAQVPGVSGKQRAASASRRFASETAAFSAVACEGAMDPPAHLLSLPEVASLQIPGAGSIAATSARLTERVRHSLLS